jgi:hypothetical protein
VRALIIALPPVAMAAVLLVFFCAVSAGVRRLVRAHCSDESRDELVDQAKNILTGISATFAFFIGFAISISWGAVTAAQNAVEQQSAAIQQMAWELRNIPDAGASAALTAKLTAYTETAATADADFLARGDVGALPSIAALNDFEDALNGYVNGPVAGAGSNATSLRASSSNLVSSAASVSAVAHRALPWPLAGLLAIVAVLVTAVMGTTTVTGGRPTMIFVYVWCLIPALSLTVVLALAFPFALRSGMTLAPLRAVADILAR